MKTYNKGFQIKNYNRQLFSDYRAISPGAKFRIWFGNPLTFIGIMFFIMGIPFTLIFAPPSALFEPSFSETDPVTKGIIIDRHGTSSYINDVQVFKYTYSYYSSDGQKYTSVGYTTGNSQSVGNELMVSYKNDNPVLSKADGLRNSEFGGGFIFFVWIFPIVGIVMLFFSIKKSIRQIQILKVGQLGEGKFLYQEATNTKINNQTVYAMTFEFKAADGNTYKAVAKTHHTNRLLDEEFEKLVYDPNQPSNAVLLDSLPKGLKIYFLNLLQNKNY